MPRAEISARQVLVTLNQVLAELEGELRRSRDDKSSIRAAIDHVSAVILMIKYRSGEPLSAKVTQGKLNFRIGQSECYRAAASILGRANRPLTSSEIATRIFNSIGVFQPTQGQIRKMVSVVNASFRSRQNTKVTMVDKEPVRWSIIPI